MYVPRINKHRQGYRHRQIHRHCHRYSHNCFYSFFQKYLTLFQIPAECAKICFSFLLPPTWRPQFSTHSRPLHFHCWCWQDGHGLNILRQFIHFLKHLVHTFSCKNFIYHPRARESDLLPPTRILGGPTFLVLASY